MCRNIRERIGAWWLGFREGFGPEGLGMTYYDDPNHPVSVAYDHGRTRGEKISRRRYN